MSHYSRRIWYHNSLRGRTLHCMSVARAVIDSETTTLAAKAYAVELQRQAALLLDALDTRNPHFEKERKANAKSHRPSLR